MNIQHSKVTVIFIVILILYTLSCTESLPLYEEPEVQFEYKFGLLHEPHIPPYTKNSPYPLVFFFSFRHFFDETLSGEYYRSGYIDIWLADKPEVKKHFEFFEYNPKETTVLDPGEFYYYLYFWDYTLDDGSKLYEHLSSIPILKAKGKIQIFKWFNKITFEEIEFTIIYYPSQPGKFTDTNDIFGKNY